MNKFVDIIHQDFPSIKVQYINSTLIDLEFDFEFILQDSTVTWDLYIWKCYLSKFIESLILLIIYCSKQAIYNLFYIKSQSRDVRCNNENQHKQKKDQGKFQNFLLQLKALIDSFLAPSPEPEEQPKAQVTKAKKQKKKQKDPLAPKMPKSAFIFYFQDKKDKFQSQYPDLQFQEITKLIASEWKDLPKEIQQVSQPKTKQQYHNSAEQDRNRYSQEQELYQSQTGKQPNGKGQAKANKSSAKKEKIIKILDQDEENDSFGADIGQD
ncbi:unnamed protein product (macronuclear) [Paramecium tetraurelia]|uniref:HMG box domain-containing protein n=1 Tax=Paramecium tetraurelia TaxID=5888 RepID=A0CC29_PARTE|nr:uncharacterized protein GSPATT00037130001 [Paramecium tetraurelia]CAK68346.1 unnamed protein product [Paramecium tetraurelia]|eukprot:XP_001435743.1 hypothetical protein (macronuclear) [Paramecium tetraurelia strain d4-2]